MEEQADELRSYLMERLGLSKERDNLVVKECEIICPRAYIVCIARLTIISSRLDYIEGQIKRLTTALLIAPYTSIPDDQPSAVDNE